jgi:hypothetical protein
VPGGTIGARGRVDLAWRLFAFASLEGIAVAARSFEISGVSGSASLPPVWVNVEGGLGLHFL